MASDRGQMKLGVSMRGYGYHPNAWRHPEARPGALLDFNHFLAITKAVEEACFDMVFLADFMALPRYEHNPAMFGRDSTAFDLEPLTLLSALASRTSNIGLVATNSSSFTEPYHIARFFASLDYLSGGRAGWNVVASAQVAEARNFSQDHLPDKAARYDRARESVTTVLRLWDSWEEDAFLHDTESGVYFDPAKMHPLDHKGEYFQVAGPLTLPRTPQGRPLIIQAGASPDGQELAAETADIVYAAHNVLAEAQAFYASLKGRMAKYGREPDHLKIMPGILAVVGETAEEAQAKYAQMQEAVDPINGMGMLTASFGDLSKYDIDGPMPDMPPEVLAHSSRVELTYLQAKRENLTLRQLYQKAFIGNSHNVVVGTPAMIADVMEEWFFGRGADGFNLVPAYTPHSVLEFTEHVIPELQRRGLTKTRYIGSTMRENMELPWPSRYKATA